MGDLNKWNGDGTPAKRSKNEQQAAEAIVARTRLAGQELDALAALYAKGMDRVYDLDLHRQTLAYNSPNIDVQLARLELGYIAKVERYLRDHGSGI